MGTPGSVIRGAQSTLERLKPWLLVELPPAQPTVEEDVQRILGAFHYSCRHCDMPIFNPDNWRGEESNIAMPPGALIRSLLCGHDDRTSASSNTWLRARRKCKKSIESSAH